jgi:hypothetical protein
MIRNLKIAGVAFAILACGSLLCRGATPEEIQRAIAEAKERLRPAPAVQPPALFVIPDTILPVAPQAKPAFLTEADLTADQQPTPMAAVTAGLNALKLRTDDVFVEFGCGFDARWAITAAKRGVRKAYGVEIDPVMAESARAYVKANGLEGRVEIITGDATQVDVPADVGAAYLWEDTLAELKPKIEKLDRFVSFAHPLPWVKDVPRDPNANIFVYSKPSAVTATVRVPAQPTIRLVRPSVAHWNGNTYTRAKSGCNCAMCQSIRAQLAPRYVTTTATQQQAAPSSGGRWVTGTRTQCTTGLFGRKTCRQVPYTYWVTN